VALVALGGCRSEGERLVDEIAQTMEESAALLGPEDSPAAATAALKHLETRSVRMRILQGRLDGVVRTLNPRQRQELGRYAGRRLGRAAVLLGLR